MFCVGFIIREQLVNQESASLGGLIRDKGLELT